MLGLLPLIILLFPDGRLPSPRWRLAVGGYLALGLADMTVQAQMSVYALTHHRTQVDTSGQLLLSNGAYSVFFAPVGLTFFAMWLLAVAYQIVRWRRSAGESRQQLSWLMAGGAVALASFIAGVVIQAHHGIWQTVGAVFVLGVAALPVSMGSAPRSRVTEGHFRRKRKAPLTAEGHPRTLSGPSPDPGLSRALPLPPLASSWTRM